MTRLDRSARRSLGWPVPKPVALVVVGVLAAALPIVLQSSYWLAVCTLALIWMILNQSWNLVLGYSGVWNFGQLAIYAIGGYTAALVSSRTGLPWPLAVVIFRANSVISNTPAVISPDSSGKPGHKAAK